MWCTSSKVWHATSVLLQSLPSSNDDLAFYYLCFTYRSLFFDVSLFWPYFVGLAYGNIWLEICLVKWRHHRRYIPLICTYKVTLLQTNRRKHAISGGSAETWSWWVIIKLGRNCRTDETWFQAFQKNVLSNDFITTVMRHWFEVFENISRKKSRPTSLPPWTVVINLKYLWFIFIHRYRCFVPDRKNSGYASVCQLIMYWW